uniref:Uncharacterized protein n=1 Tax=Noccaea caerulescens TaxID=107243 RepID=A0A1J3JV41_NOCCA
MGFRNLHKLKKLNMRCCEKLRVIPTNISCWYNDDKIIECGAHILAEKAESSRSSSEVDNFDTESISSEVDNFEIESSSSEVDYCETGGNNNHHIYGDGGYEAEAFMVSQGENTKTSKHTSCWSWFEKLGLKKKKKKKMNKTQQTSRGVS